MPKGPLVVWLGVAVCLITALSYFADASAQTQSSSSYRFEESVLGTGGLIESSSNNYKVTEGIGDPLAGDASSTNFNLSAGSKTSPDPALRFAITQPVASFAPFSPNNASTATTEFTVSNYTSYGYAVQITGSEPKHSSGHVIPGMATTGPSVPGTEQFGINLVANTAPANFGANPAHGLFAFGDATPNYATPNDFRFVNGESIAMAPKSSGVTTYTISYIINVNSLTPGGDYTGAQTLICTGTY